MRRLRAFLWPIYTASTPRLFQRLGRVLHWTLAAAAPVMGAALLFRPDVPSSVALAVFAGLMLLGRAVRYILSAE